MALTPYTADRISVGPAGCWYWTGTITETGYGLASYRDDSGQRRTIRAHRLVYQQLVGPIPAGLEIDHMCRVRRCVNPEHLDVVTRRENQLRSNSVSAQAARRTHCKRGHEYVPLPEVRRGARRHCPTCERARWR